MKTIASLKGPEFLRASNRVRHQVTRFLRETHLLDLRRRLPKLEGVTGEDREKALQEQARQNLSDMLDLALDTYPEETYKLLCALIVREDGDPEEPDGIDLIRAVLDLLSSPKIINFFTSFMSTAPTGTPKP